jgi:hypothetical protein
MEKKNKRTLKQFLQEMIGQGHEKDEVVIHTQGEKTATVYEIGSLNAADCFLTKDGKVTDAKDEPMMVSSIREIIPCTSFIPKSRKAFCLVELEAQGQHSPTPDEKEDLFR